MYPVRTTRLSIPQGAMHQFAWPIFANGEPLDVSEWTARGQVRERVESTTPLHEWSTALGTILTDQNRITVVTTASMSTGWTWRQGVYDIEATDPDGRTFRIAEGAVYVRPEVTR